jgi:hypothetical protein
LDVSNEKDLTKVMDCHFRDNVPKDLDMHLAHTAPLASLGLVTLVKETAMLGAVLWRGLAELRAASGQQP